jgi:para-nitrobenzyl esterase
MARVPTMRPVVACAVLTAMLQSGCLLRADTVQTTSGLIRGAIVPDTQVRVFRGIPFAQAPVGALRWKPPQPVSPWEGVRDCTQFGPCCPQPPSLLQSVAGPVSEDCLYLNVWTPARGPDDRLPVMIWIHGGGFTTGSGSKALYRGEALAAEGVVVVTINYRLGPFGFLAHPALSAESPQGVSGNYGLLDQIAAVQWVQREIAAFGGDPGNVTIFGESAGAISVCCLLASPLSQGLFHHAIAQSGTAYGIRVPLKSGDQAQPSMEQTGVQVAKRLGVANGPEAAALLRSVPADRLLAAAAPSVGLLSTGDRFWPGVDGYVLPDEPGRLFGNGRFHHVPIMLGTNADEGSIFVGAQSPVRGALAYRMILRRIFGTDGAREVETMYPVGPNADVQSRLSQVLTDALFIAPARRLSRALAVGPGSPTYVYHFTRVSPAAARKGVGACHGAEIPYVFDTFPQTAGYDDVDRSLGAEMRQAWVRFARSGDPNGGDLPPWPAYTGASETYMQFGDSVKTGTNLHEAACDLFDRIGTGPVSPGGGTL